MCAVKFNLICDLFVLSDRFVIY